MELLAPRFNVLAPDSYGAGKSPEWPSDRQITLADEVALIEPVLRDAGSPLTLVGHSYGAAIALRAALDRPARDVRGLVLYEPTLFSLIDAEAAPPNEADGIRDAVADAARALDRGDRDAAAEAFIDYWMGEGAWQRMPEARREPIAASAVNVRRWAHALFPSRRRSQAFRRLGMPVLLLVGGRTTASARGVAQLLVGAPAAGRGASLRRARAQGPVTHPEPVNAAIARFLESV